MKNKIYFLACILFLVSKFSSAATITSNAVTGNWSAGTSWVGGTAPGASDVAIVVSGAIITVTANASVTSLTINTGGYVKTGTAGSGNFALTMAVGGTFTIQAGGTYENNNSQAWSTTIFRGTESFASTSTIIVNDDDGNATLISASSSNFGHLTLNRSSGAFFQVYEGLGFTRTIQGDLTIGSSATVIANAVAGNIVCSVGGNLIVNGTFRVKNAVSGNVTFTVTGNTTISGTYYGIYLENGNVTYSTAAFSISAGSFRGISSGTGSYTMTVNGNWTHSGGQVIGISYPTAGNNGTTNCTINGNLTLTGGSIIWHSTEITDGRSCSVSITGDCSLAMPTGSDFFIFNNVTSFTTNNTIYNFTVGGNLTISGTSGVFTTKWTNTGQDNISIAGDMSLSGATTSFAGGFPNPTFMPNNTLNATIGGRVSITGAAIFYSQSSNNTSKIDLTVGTASVTWAQTSSGTVSLCNTNIKSGKTVTMTGTKMGDIQTSRTITVESGAKLYCSNFPVSGTGAFTLASGAWIGSGSAAGIVSAGATGNIQVTGTRTFNSGATYEYYEAITPQSTGNFTTTTTSGTYPSQVTNLIINKTLGTNVVNLTNTTDVTTLLTLTSGVLTTSTTAATAPWVRIPTDVASVTPVGGSASSYVDGYIRKTGSSAFIYPTGNAGKWRRIAQDAPSISEEFEARYVSSAYANTATMSAAPVTVLDHVSTAEHWFLSKPLGVTAATTKVTLYWEDASASAIFKFDSLAVGRWSGTGWENTNCYGSCPANWTTSTAQRTYTGSAAGAGAGTIKSNTVSSFSPFTFSSIGTYTLNPLPIELLTFTALLNSNSVDITWATASEINNDYFTIEKSTDAQNFVKVLNVDGAGNSTHTIDYFEKDYNPSVGISYYRLKQTDFDGKVSYSNIVPVEYYTNGESSISIFPNPNDANAITYLALNELEGQEVLVVLRDIAGREIFSKVLICASNNEIVAIGQEGEIAKGSYLVTASSKNKFYNKKLIIK